MISDLWIATIVEIIFSMNFCHRIYHIHRKLMILTDFADFFSGVKSIAKLFSHLKVEIKPLNARIIVWPESRYAKVFFAFKTCQLQWILNSHFYVWDFFSCRHRNFYRGLITISIWGELSKSSFWFSNLNSGELFWIRVIFLTDWYLMSWLWLLMTYRMVHMLRDAAE